MIWHLYGNNDKVILTDSPHQSLHKTALTSSSPTTISTTTTVAAEEENSSYATIKKPYASPESNSLFLSFPSRLKTNKVKVNKTTKPKQITVNGVNILNKKNIDTKIAAEKIQKRRATHNSIERRRRDNINNTIYEISQMIPYSSSLGQEQKLNKHNILKSAISYILFLQSENEHLKQQVLVSHPVEAISSNATFNEVTRK